MKFYISGKIGEEYPKWETLKKFKDAEVRLRNKGFDVFNPTTSGLGKLAEATAKAKGTTFYEEIMSLDLKELQTCDAVLMLNDWRSSDGAKVELMLAKALKKPVYQEAPNGKLYTVNLDVTLIRDYSSLQRGLCVGDVMQVLRYCSEDTPVAIAADFILGAPFEQGFDKQVHGEVFEARITDDNRAPRGIKVVFDSSISCALSFD